MKQSNIYVRIRPEASDGGGHDKDGEAVEKSRRIYWYFGLYQHSIHVL